MRRLLWSGVGVTLGLSALAASAGDQREVIAVSGTAPAASLGKPVATPPLKVRAQMGDKPAAPPPATVTPAPIMPEPGAQLLPYPSNVHTPQATAVPYGAVPYGAAVPMPGPGFSSGPIGAPVAVPAPGCSGGPCGGGPSTGFIGTPCDLGGAPTPGGWFNNCGGSNGPRWYISGDYLYWWIRDAGLPPLVTTGTPQGNRVIESGNLNRAIDPDTRVLFGNGPIDNQGRNGGKFEIGRWFGQNKPWAIEFGGFFLGDRSTNFRADSNQFGTLSRPFIVANIPREGVDNFAQPGLLAGSIDITGNSSFYGANVDWRRKLYCGCRFNLDGMVGFRYLNYDENLNIVERSTVIANNVVAPNLNNAPIPLGLTNIITDRFRVDNDFYGGMMGLSSTYHVGRFSLDMGAKVSLGTTHERLTIAGDQVIIYPNGQRFPFTGGLLTRPSNIGTFSQDKFTVVPEVNFGVGYQLTPHFKFNVGYNFLYWNNVLRVGDQIDRTVNINGIPYFPQTGRAGNTDPVTNQAIPQGPNRPLAILRETDFWAQGISTGLLWTW